MPKREENATSVTVPEKLYGYNGRVLRVNLSNGKIDSESISEKFCRKYLGGAGFNVYIDRERYNKAKKFYYALMGWDANGVPLPEKAEELGIE